MELFWIISGMSIVTIVPRILPSFIMDYLSLSPFINRWLKTIPYAALGALIFPGVLSVDPQVPLLGLIGGIMAAILAYFKLHILYVILGSIFSVMLLKIIGVT
ncbi:branched-chain amino acid transport [Alkaliphilus metalliredigens QYMF]|uniref:Branched-chain amino acid transport n=1 Tax=Alkaliphilus metalliredigens (strain QYMF) TaxID=293826 RepID=A6TMK5_ALKMQ|nr:AzlD domain-containing protein [Alkaliphilus metalliredigens]ABR47423.1 branched-chain amino acid transport [Alkaliphilus metalliredigens QYMF]